MILSPRRGVESLMTKYLERTFNTKKHQDVIHAMMDKGIWDSLVEDVTQGVMGLKRQGFSSRALDVYIAERTKLYAKTFLQHLEEQVGTEALIEEELVKEN